MQKSHNELHILRSTVYSNSKNISTKMENMFLLRTYVAYIADDLYIHTIIQ